MSYPEHLIDYWKENGLTPPVEVVVCAANRLEDGTIIAGARHWDVVMRGVADKLDDKTLDAEQGFINQFGVFLDRVEALAVAKASGQPLNMERNGSTDMLFSEGLY